MELVFIHFKYHHKNLEDMLATNVSISNISCPWNIFLKISWISVPSCWNHISLCLTPNVYNATWTKNVAISKYRSEATIIQWFSSKEHGPIIPKAAKLHQTVTFLICNGFSCCCIDGSSRQYLQLSLLTLLKNVWCY